MISVEGHVIFEGVQPTFVTGFAAVLATFYIFNLQYQDEVAKTLEFSQRKGHKDQPWEDGVQDNPKETVDSECRCFYPDQKPDGL
ncbi:hypothetical protein CHARACLAT_028680 [Characodon lateralis]|uniref:Uncharacterized protein n=1 Tax=Characodon lateralis TaxID=208331 RepID=A0ABU7DDU3_9TELE|nr:hypothetical protein [Characodon lateralis]